jgi:hypothetical protein
VAKSSFTLTTSAGQEVTVDEESSTKYEKGTTSVSNSADTKGTDVLVLGTVDSTAIKATQVIVQKNAGGSESTTAAAVVPLPEGCCRNVKADRSDPRQLQPGIRDDRQRNDSQQGDRSCVAA